MIGTESAALTWWCHKIPRGANDRCLASGCAAWRWATDELEFIKTGVQIKANDEGPAEPLKPVTIKPPEGAGWMAHSGIVREEEIVFRGKTRYVSFFRYWSRPRAEREGYCGAK